MKILSESWMGYEFFGEKIMFPSAPVLGINDDQSLNFQVEYATVLDNHLTNIKILVSVML